METVNRPLRTNAARQARWRASHKEEIRAWQRAQAHERPFIAWDGEGLNEPNGDHTYVLFAGSDGTNLVQREGVPALDIFDALIASRMANPSAIHVIYGGSYDFNMWLKDVGPYWAEKLYTGETVRWCGYFLSWRPGKTFRITQLQRGKSVSVTVYDVVSFFQCSFVDACDAYLGDNWLERDRIVAEKKRRGSFTFDEIAAIGKYNDAELTNLVALMNNLRERLVSVDLVPKRWDGPGAIAAALLTKEKVKRAVYRGEYDPALYKAIRTAYSGGRFEPFQYGHHPAPVYEYDVNSAYPAAMGELPNLNNGYWRHSAKPKLAPGFAVYRIAYDAAPNSHTLPGALWVRRKDGSIQYPMHTEGWYWAPEAMAAQRYIDAHGGSLRVLEAWRFHETGTDDRPFDFVRAYYQKRLALKRAGDGAERAIKLGLNSLYGKLAQQVGWSVMRSGDVKLPPFHQLEWAGYITAWCRARILDAISQAPDAIIATETDALFSTRKLDLPLSNKLGEWECTEFEAITYIQSGFYYGPSKRVVNKSRGLERGFTLSDEIDPRLISGELTYTTQLSRFYGIGIARMGQWEKWCRWESITREMDLYPWGKRSSCAILAGTLPDYSRLNDTLAVPFGGQRRESYEYAVAWADNSNAAADVGAEMRHEPNEWED